MNPQESSIEKTNALTKAMETMKSEGSVFKEGQLLRMLIVDKLPNNKIILFFNGDTFFAESNLALEKGQTILAKVKSIIPNTVLSLIPDAAKDLSSSSDNAVANRLKLMNILPKSETVEAAKAFISENMSLREKDFLSFMESVSKLNLTSKEDLQIAAKMNKLSVPLTEEMFNRFKAFLTDEAPGISLEEFPQKIKEMMSQMPDFLKSSLQTLVKTLEKGLEGMTVEDLSKTSATINQMEKSLTFNGNAFEKMLMSRLYEKIFDAQQFTQNVDAFQEGLKNLETLVQELEGKAWASETAVKPLREAIQEFLKFTQTLEQSLKNVPAISEKALASKSSEPGLLSSLIPSSSKVIMKWAESFDRLLSAFEKFFSDPLSTGSDFSQWKGTAETVLRGLYEHAGEVFSMKEETLKASLLTPASEALSDTVKDQKATAENLLSTVMKHLYQRDAHLDMPPNYKEVLHRLEAGLQESVKKTGVKDSIIQENTAAAKAVNDLETEAKQIVNQMYKEQLSMLSDDQISKSGYFQLFLKEESGQKQPVKFYYKENTSGNGKGGGADKKSYFIFFSMQLSQIGYFEVNILDLNKKLDITFFSENSEVRRFFESQSQDLLGKLEGNDSISVSLKTATPQKKKQEQALLDLKPMTGKSGSVDILI